MDHYRRLGVRRDASTAEIRSAFHARVRSVHPDASGANDPAAFRDLVAAWHVLRDSRGRAAYDASLGDGAAAPSGSRRPKTRVTEPPLADVTMPHVWRPVVVACAVVVMAFLAVMVLIAFATPPPGS